MTVGYIPAWKAFPVGPRPFSRSGNEVSRAHETGADSLVRTMGFARPVVTSLRQNWRVTQSQGKRLWGACGHIQQGWPLSSAQGSGRQPPETVPAVPLRPGGWQAGSSCWAGGMDSEGDLGGLCRDRETCRNPSEEPLLWGAVVGG